jgi:uncharacterized protein YjaZ
MLPKDDDDPMTIAFYPSENNMKEGIFGTCVWGNIIMNVNPVNKNAVKWLPFVFAHEYHHCVLGFYWYCVKGGTETKGNFLEYLINEGQADNFAQSIYPSFCPSWHKGVSKDCKQDIWKKFKEILYTVAPTEQFAPYMFGDSALGIPPNAGYYFGYSIVKAYIDKHTNISFSELIQIPHQQIFEESGFSLL